MNMHLTLFYPCHDKQTALMVDVTGKEARRTCPACGTRYRVVVCVRDRKWFARWSKITESFGPEVENQAV